MAVTLTQAAKDRLSDPNNWDDKNRRYDWDCYDKTNIEISAYQAALLGIPVYRMAGHKPVIVTSVKPSTRDNNINVEMVYLDDLDKVYRDKFELSYIFYEARKVKEPVENPCAEILLEGKEEMANNKTLYQIKDTEKYGYHIATNSKGLWVIELKGSNGDVISVDKDTVEEVIPYSLCVKYLNSLGDEHFETDEGKFKEGDLLMTPSGNFGYVKKLDTKSKNTKGEFKGWKLSAEKIG